MVLVWLYRYLTTAPVPKVEQVAPSTTTSVEELIKDWAKLEAWLTSEKPAEDDLLGNRNIASRMAKHLNPNGGSIGLIGPFGSGKSTVITWLKEEVKQKRQEGQPELWFAEQSCWGFEDSGSAVQQVLAKVMETVSSKVDCFSFRFLPEAYRKTFSTGGSWLRTVADLVLGSADSLAQFRQLGEVLELVNARLVLIIEDLDRTTSTRFDRQEILALLHRFRQSSKQFSFILATGTQSARDIDFAKLCDHIEQLLDFDSTQVSRLIEAVKQQCKKIAIEDIACEGFTEPSVWTCSDLPATFDTMTLPKAATHLLRTPRALKHALRRTYLVWNDLHGEVDFDLLLGVNILRQGAPEAFNFLLRYWYQLHQTKTDSMNERGQPRYEVLGSEWDRETNNAEWDVRAGLTILGFVLPTASEYLGLIPMQQQIRRQGISHKRYWLRIVDEEIATEDMRDQTILHDFEDWEKCRKSDSPLIVGLCSCEKYLELWNLLASVMCADKSNIVLDLLEQLRKLIGTEIKPRSPDKKHPSDSPYVLFTKEKLTAIRSRVVYFINSSGQAPAWLKNQIESAMKTSLKLVNDLYRFRAISGMSDFSKAQLNDVRSFIREQSESQLKSGEDLLSVCQQEFDCEVYRLVFPPQPSEKKHQWKDYQQWRWLGSHLLHAFRLAPEKFALDVGLLISDSIHDKKFKELPLAVSPERFQGFFGESKEEVVSRLDKAMEHFKERDREILEQIVQSARKFLDTTDSEKKVDLGSAGTEK